MIADILIKRELSNGVTTYDYLRGEVVYLRALDQAETPFPHDPTYHGEPTPEMVEAVASIADFPLPPAARREEHTNHLPPCAEATVPGDAVMKAPTS